MCIEELEAELPSLRLAVRALSRRHKGDEGRRDAPSGDAASAECAVRGRIVLVERTSGLAAALEAEDGCRGDGADARGAGDDGRAGRGDPEVGDLLMKRKEE